MKTFTLNPTPQTQAFLVEKRKDPVTGETFKEGDEIVFCASCKSAFLKGSWEYMGGQHCGQSETLEVFPVLASASKGIRLIAKGGEIIIALPPSDIPFLEKKTFKQDLVGFISALTILFLSGNFLTILFILVVCNIIRAAGRHIWAPKNEFRNSGVIIRGCYFPYQDISECRVALHKTRSGKQLKIEILFHDKDTSETLIP